MLLYFNHLYWSLHWLLCCISNHLYWSLHCISNHLHWSLYCISNHLHWSLYWSLYCISNHLHWSLHLSLFVFLTICTGHFTGCFTVFLTICTGCFTGRFTVFLAICTGRFTGCLVHYLYFSGPGVIPLKHYGKREVLGKIANMEAEYNKPMHFDPDLPAVAGTTGHQGFWDYGIEVAGKAKKYSKQTPTLGSSYVWV